MEKNSRQLKKYKVKNKRSFWQDGLSINETKFSMLMFLTVVGFIYALVAHYRTGDITDNLVNLVQGVILGVVGVNVADTVGKSISKRREDYDSDSYNNYEKEDDY